MAAAAHWDGAQKGTVWAAVALSSKRHAGHWPVARSVSCLTSACHYPPVRKVTCVGDTSTVHRYGRGATS
eukprot:5217341-Pleurochrysis_carterae.AAC.1